MPINSVTGSITNAAASATTPAAAAKDQFGQDTFLKLLVAQLKYQDPMNPADGTEFLSQTAQFTQVEKTSEIVKMQTELLAAQRLLGASNLIGQNVTYKGADGNDITGVVKSAHLATDGTVLRVNDKDVPLSSITEVGGKATA